MSLLSFSLGGVSIKGEHERNQDYYITNVIEDISYLILADGLGSKPLSDIGSKAICSIISDLIISNPSLVYSMKELISQAHSKWVEKLSQFVLEDCSCTCLVCVVTKCDVFIAHLGDGFICCFDGKNHHISVGEELDFINETHSLSYNLNFDKWNFSHFEKDENCYVFMCSDGVSVDDCNPNSIENFCIEMAKEYKLKISYDIEKDINSWLRKWVGSDDKTLTFYLESSETNGV